MTFSAASFAGELECVLPFDRVDGGVRDAFIALAAARAARVDCVEETDKLSNLSDNWLLTSVEGSMIVFVQ